MARLEVFTSVGNARLAGHSWREIGEALDITGQAAHKRFAEWEMSWFVHGERVFSLRQAADMVGMTHERFYSLHVAGDGPEVHEARGVAGEPLFSVEAITAWAERSSRTRKATAK